MTGRGDFARENKNFGVGGRDHAQTRTVRFGQISRAAGLNEQGAVGEAACENVSDTERAVEGSERGATKIWSKVSPWQCARDAALRKKKAA